MTLHVTNSSLKLAQPLGDVLLVEDEPLVQALVLRYLSTLEKQASSYQHVGPTPESFAVQTLISGWDLLHSDLSGVRVLVVDILLPQITGVDLIKHIRKQYPHMGIVPMSGMATEPMKRSLKELLPESSHLLPKPLRKEDFLEAFVRAWNFQDSLVHISSQQQPQPSLTPLLEEGEELWTAVKAHQETLVPVMRRGSLRKKSVA